jgi:hypothetical protein
MDTTPSNAVYPLAAALNRVTVVDENACADIGSLESGWFQATALCDQGSILLNGALARQAKDHPQMEARTRGAYLIGNYSWYVPLAGVVAYLAAARVPDFSPENVALCLRTYTWHEGEHSGEAERMDVRFLNGRFACLPDDPAANHPDAIVLPDSDTLREWLRTRLEAHLTPLIERVFAQTRLSRGAQWCLVADSCAALFLHVGQALGDAARGQGEGLKFVKAPDSPMTNDKTSYISLQYLDHRETFRARGGCCRYYTVSETGEDYCTTCVLRKPEDRDQRLLDYMAKKYVQEAAS